MKYLSKYACLLLVIVTLFSCDEVDELTDIDITGDFDTTVTVDITEDSEGDPISFENSRTIDIATNETIQENLDLIEKVSVNSFTYEFTNYEGPDGGTVSDASISVGDMTIDIEDIDIDAAATAGTVYTITDTSFIETIASFLENQPEITVTFTATISSSPVSFDVIVNLNATVTVDTI